MRYFSDPKANFDLCLRNIKLSRMIQRILAYIDQNFDKTIYLSDGASLGGIHPHHLCRKFKKELGISFHGYILKIRIRRAAFLLADSEKSVKEISYEVGFSRPEIFSKAFKRQVGCSPMAYRATDSLFGEGSSAAGAPAVPFQSVLAMTQSEAASMRSYERALEIKK